ncbi:MAG TPA: heavy-metal-associated domain-containing protein [Gammaproteobacteria bacterium]|nr:heavy-metal-associated domain-containing protein [Gammaproteobacteria bacterium]
MLRGLLITLTIVVWSVNGWAKEFNYQAHVEGMVCAFCAYSVSKNIGSLPGVDAESVNVDLESGRVDFRADRQVSRQSLEAVFTESGFRIDKLGETAQPSSGGESPKELSLILDIRLDSLETDRFEAVFEAVGNIAAGSPSRTVIEAPASLEGNLLKPVLMGRQQVMKVRFRPLDTGSIHIQLYM